MRIGKEKTEPKEATFKVSKKAREHKYHQDCSRCGSNQELAHFSRRLKHGSGKYKGKLPFKCFDCGKESNIFHPSSLTKKIQKRKIIKSPKDIQKHQKKNFF